MFSPNCDISIRILVEKSMRSSNFKMTIFKNFIYTLKICKLGLNIQSNFWYFLLVPGLFRAPESEFEVSFLIKRSPDKLMVRLRTTLLLLDNFTNNIKYKVSSRGALCLWDRQTGMLPEATSWRWVEVNHGLPLNMYIKLKLYFSWATLNLDKMFKHVR